MTDRYAVVGRPIAQSKSPAIHAAFAAQTRQDVSYGAIEAAPGGFAGAADAFRAAGGRGLNVTAPFKLDAVAYATTASAQARRAAAANCLRFDGETVEAENFDGIGLRRDIEVNLGVSLAGRRVLLLGAGGAVRGALLPLLHAGPAVLVIAARAAANARALVDAFDPDPALEGAGFEALPAHAPFDIVLNATSSSLYGACPEIPAGVFAAQGLAYDLTYGKGLTPFLALAEAAGAGRLHDGVGMLVEQAAEAFVWWRGVRPATRAVIDGLTVPLR